MKHKKSKKKLDIVAFMLAVLFWFNTVPGVSAVDREPTYEELFAAQKMAVDANETLMRYFHENGWREEYPNYYGGRYIADNILYIRLLSPSAKTMEMLEDMLRPYSEAVVYEFCEYSFAESQAYANDIALELVELGYAVTSWYVDNRTGDVVISVQEDVVEEVTEIVDVQQTYTLPGRTPDIIIKKGEYMQTQTELVYGGTQFRNGSGFSGSVGICGTYNGVKAFVTCGHGMEEGEYITYNQRAIGTVSKVQYSYGEQGDYSIITINNNADVTHKVGYSEDVLTGGVMLSPAIGTYVTKYGAESGYAYGTVTETDVNVLRNNGMVTTRMTNAVLTGGNSVGGDSGGPYIAGNTFCGVHSGVTVDGNETILHFTPYSVINAGGFTAYGAHACTSWNDAGSSSHSGYCSICKEVVYEEHSAYWNHMLGFCRRCGRSGSVAI